MFKRFDGAMLGVAPPQGVFIIDIDHRPNRGAHAGAALDALVDLYPELGCTPLVQTPSGGFHIAAQTSSEIGVRNGTDVLAPCIDVRTKGGYVIAPPSQRRDAKRYTLIRGGPIMQASPDFMAALTVRSTKHKTNGKAGTDRTPAFERDLGRCSAVPGLSMRNMKRRRAYVDAAFQGEIARVAGAPEGTRNLSLFKAAARSGELVARGLLNEAAVAAALVQAAAQCGLVADDGLSQAQATIASGLKHGRATPRTLPEGL